MLVTSLLCQIILATAALAVPTARERLADRIARRADGVAHQSQPKQSVDFQQNGIDTNSTHSSVSYSSNWAGAVLSQKSVRRHLGLPRCSAVR